MESIIVALIGGGVTLIGVLIANGKTQAVTDTKLEELTREVREHNTGCGSWKTGWRSIITMPAAYR